MLDNITPIILTFNEEENLARTLIPLRWAKEVLLIDSGSTDGTLEIASQFDNIRVIHHAFEDFATQCNFALQQDIRTDWVLSLDADYVVTNELVRELSELQPDQHINGYQVSFQYVIDGAPLRGSLYPPRTCLYRHDRAHYQQDGHAHRVVVDGQTQPLRSKVQHDDRKPYSRWLSSQQNYAVQEARKLKSTPWRSLKTVDKLRRLGLAPLLILPFTLLAKGVLLDGKPGWTYARQRYTAELTLWKALFTRPSKPA